VGPALSGPSCIYHASSHQCIYTQLIQMNNPTPPIFSSFTSAKGSSEAKMGIYYRIWIKLKLFWLLIRGNLHQWSYSLHLFQSTSQMLLYPELSPETLLLTEGRAALCLIKLNDKMCGIWRHKRNLPPPQKGRSLLILKDKKYIIYFYQLLSLVLLINKETQNSQNYTHH